ncbi:MAG: SDR family oxidoreductase [Anaerolineae bacterium]|nr:SDR family oxidoreductase [Anaerolineae bacterium]
MRFENQVVLITGGGSGIGRAAARLFAAEGASVVVADLDANAGQAIVSELSAHGGTAMDVQVDITRADSVAAMVQSSIGRFRQIDALFHSAGIFETGLITEVDEAHWDRVINVNLKGTFLTLQAVVPMMLRQKRGAIVTMGSIAGLVVFPNNPAYIASKAGVLMLTKAIARDYGEQGIRANVICPGPVEGPMMDRVISKAADPNAELNSLTERVLLKRFASPEEIARVALFLCSEDSSYITGESILVDGGKLTMNK